MSVGTLLDDFLYLLLKLEIEKVNDVMPEELKRMVADICDKGCQCVACDNTGCNK